MTPNQAADLARRVEVAATLRPNAQGKYDATPATFALGVRNIRKKMDKSNVPTFGADVFQIVQVNEAGPNAIGLTTYKIAKETEDGGLEEEPLKGGYNDSQLLRISNVEEYVPPAPYVDSEDDEFPDGYNDGDDEPVQRRRIDQRELDDLELNQSA